MVLWLVFKSFSCNREKNKNKISNVYEMEVKVKCRKCGRMDSSTNYTLDNFYGMVVCAMCVKDKKHKQSKPEIAPAQKPKMPGWDAEDDLLERAYKAKQQSTVVVKQLGNGRVNYNCPMCKYAFEYDPIEKKPGKCPYCSGEVFRVAY